MLIRAGRPSWALSRRALLKGAGVAMALPFLDAMSWRARAADPYVAPVRFLAFYVPNGIHMPAWTPSFEGALTADNLTPILSGLRNVVGDVTVLSRLDNDAGTAQGDGPGDHARGTGTFITAAHPKKTEGSDIRIGPSVDQLIANAQRANTRFASLELGCEGGGSTGGCDSGYSCAYSRNIAWSSPTTPVAKETNPAAAFDRLFAGVDPAETQAQLEKRKRLKQSVLDYVKADGDRLKRKLGARDQAKLDEYLTGVRAIETRLNGPQPAVCAPPDRQSGVPGDTQAYVRAMFDIVAIAFACDLTRSATFMLGNGGSNRSYGFIGVPDAHHEISHHQGDATKQAKLQQIDTWEVEQLAYLLEKLKGIGEGDGQDVLRNSVVFFGSEIEDGNSHSHAHMPVLVCGRGGGQINSGRHVRFPDGTPIANLFLELLRICGAPQASFGDDGAAPLSLA